MDYFQGPVMWKVYPCHEVIMSQQVISNDHNNSLKSSTEHVVKVHDQVDDLAQDSGNAIANVLEIPQSCAKTWVS